MKAGISLLVPAEEKGKSGGSCQRLGADVVMFGKSGIFESRHYGSSA